MGEKNMTFKFDIMGYAMDLTKISIMSRGVDVDQAFCDKYRIRYIYNRVESVDFYGMDAEEIKKGIRGTMVTSSKEILGRKTIAGGSCMLVEGGLKNVEGGQVVVTTIFHFEDNYSMNMFVLQYPHKMWNHMKDMFTFTN